MQNEMNIATWNSQYEILEMNCLSFTYNFTTYKLKILAILFDFYVPQFLYLKMDLESIL